MARRLTKAGRAAISAASKERWRKVREAKAASFTTTYEPAGNTLVTLNGEELRRLSDLPPAYPIQAARDAVDNTNDPDELYALCKELRRVWFKARRKFLEAFREEFVPLGTEETEEAPER